MDDDIHYKCKEKIREYSIEFTKLVDIVNIKLKEKDDEIDRLTKENTILQNRLNKRYSSNHIIPVDHSSSNIYNEYDKWYPLFENKFDDMYNQKPLYKRSKWISMNKSIKMF